MPKTGVCPVCNGTLRVTAPFDRTYPYANIIHSYDSETHTVNCTNCGGQYQHVTPVGIVNLRPNGEPCKHKYESIIVGNCLREYTCIHCSDRYRIDSGD